MERLTDERGRRTWRLFKAGWYVNIALFCLCLALSVSLFLRMWHGYYDSYAVPVTITMTFLVLACLLLLGAGLSRYQARLEGQHLEIKLAVGRLVERMDTLQASVDQLRESR